MAHADYNCCAVCDCKLAYNGGGAETKEELCAECAVTTGCKTPREVEMKLDAMNDAAALIWLHQIGFSPCYYPNALDDYLIARHLVETQSNSPGEKWGKVLKALPKLDADENLSQLSEDNSSKAFGIAQANRIKAYLALIEQLEREIKYLRHYGNKDCTHMADQAMANNEMEKD